MERIDVYNSLTGAGGQSVLSAKVVNCYFFDALTIGDINGTIEY